MNGLREGPDGAEIIVDSSICDGKDDEHGLAIVGTDFHQLFQIYNCFVWRLLIKVRHCSVEECIIIRFVRQQTLGEHFGSILVFLVSQEKFARFEVFFTFQNLLFSNQFFFRLLNKILRDLGLNQ